MHIDVVDAEATARKSLLFTYHRKEHMVFL